MPFFRQRLRPVRAAQSSLRIADTAPPSFFSSARLAVFVSLWLATVCNVPLWAAVRDLPGDGLSIDRLGFMLAFGAVVAAGNVALLSLLGWRRTVKPMAAALVLMAAFGAYFMLAYGIVIDATMLANVLQTDVQEAGDLFNWRLVATVVVLAGPPLWWLWHHPLPQRTLLRQALHNVGLLAVALVVAVLGIVLVFQEFASTMRNHTQLRYLINPLNSVYALGNIATRPLRMDTRQILPIGRDAQLGVTYSGQPRPPLLVLVLGETGRASNFALNGYGRPTTPLLSARSDLISARNAWACGTSTAASVPCMFSHLSRNDFESRKANFEGLMDVLQHAGLAVLWVDNQSGCKGVCDRIPNASTFGEKDPDHCPGGSDCLDTIMLKGLDERLAALPAEQRQRGTVVVLHQMGSHGPAYYKRSAPERKVFLPECRSNALQECSREQVVNAYDNSIVETDFFLDSVIKWLQGHEAKSNTAMIYVSDHGESLGENNIYLHGLPYAIAPDVQKHVPWLTWLSPAMQARARISTGCLRRQLAEQRVTHDHYFHSVLGLMNVQTGIYDPALDMFADCMQSAAAADRPASAAR